MSDKMRLDVAVFEQGHTDSREKARALIMAGQVYVNGQKELKSGAQIKPTDAIEVRGSKMPYVSRGGYKLEKAMNNGSKTMSDYDRGRICYYMGDYENACSYLDNANKNNSSEEVVLALGQSYEATGDINFAASIYTNYLSSNGDSASIYNQLGLCRLATGDYDAALSSIESGIAMNDADVMQTLKYNEIICYEYLGDFTKAKVLMESYLVVYPDDETALREYDFLATR